jgi:hypothetical protein
MVPSHEHMLADTRPFVGNPRFDRFVGSDGPTLCDMDQHLADTLAVHIRQQNREMFPVDLPARMQRTR